MAENKEDWGNKAVLIKIVYCAGWNYTPRYLALKKAINDAVAKVVETKDKKKPSITTEGESSKNEFGEDKITNAFEVEVNGVLVHSKLTGGPTHGFLTNAKVDQFLEVVKKASRGETVESIKYKKTWK